MMDKYIKSCVFPPSPGSYAYSFSCRPGAKVADILLAGIGGIRARGRALGSIPLGLASASQSFSTG